MNPNVTLFFRNILKYNVNPIRLFFLKKFFLNNPIITLSHNETISKIINERLSFIRFGDGEFQCISGLMLRKSSGFNSCHNEIRNLLIKTLTMSRSDTLIGIIPSPVVELFGKKKNNNLHWNEYQYYRNYKVVKLLDKTKVYGDSTCFLRGQYKKDSEYFQYLELIKSIWEGSDVVFVTGKNSRFNKDSSNLFERIKSHKFIWTPDENSYSDFNRILEESLQESKDKLFILSSGFLSKVLGMNLIYHGYRVVDVGHMTYYM